MDTNSVTTPFGRRPMTLAMLAGQSIAQPPPPERSVDKWKLYRALCEARSSLGITDRSLALLNALLSFYPKSEISAANGLVVFPSNQQLSLRANGMAEPTIRRHIALLVSAGLLARKDSANGKRYVRRNREGEMGEAFGFSLAPLLHRSEEIRQRAEAVIAERRHLQEVRESLTICRRDIAKLIEAARCEAVPGEWTALHGQFRDLVDGIPRKLDLDHALQTLRQMEALRTIILNILKTPVNTQEPNGSPMQNERHIKNSESEFFSESEPGDEPEEPITPVAPPNRNPGVEIRRDFPLNLVTSACPSIASYAPKARIADWHDLDAATIVVRTMLGISPSAYQAACRSLGRAQAAIAVACILERSAQIQRPGGYLRELTRKSEEGNFSLGPMLMALMKARGRAPCHGV